MSGTELFTTILICILLLVGASGCTTTHQLTTTSPEDLMASINAGDVVQIERQDDTNLEFTVTKVSDEGIHGSGIFVSYAEITRISVARNSWLSTGLMAASVVVVLYVLEKNADCGIIKWDETCDDM